MMNKMTINWLMAGILALGLSACQQNPFEDAMKVPGAEISKEKLEQKEPFKEWVITSDSSFDCVETITCKVMVRVQVPKGEPVVRVTQLPPGATEADFAYDPKYKAYVLTWTPSFDVVEPSKQKGVTATVPVEFTLSSSLEPQTIIPTDKWKFTVLNSPRPWSVNTVGVNKVVREGDLLTQEVVVENLDYPKGPFTLAMKDAPAGVELKNDPTNPLKFIVTYRPDFSFVKANNPNVKRDASSYYLDIPVTFIAKDPGEGVEKTKTTSWRVRDVRKATVISGPSSIGVREKAVFSIRADDLNAESAPDFKLKVQAPFGRVIETVKKEARPGTSDYPSTFLNVEWTDIPADQQGKTASLRFEACPTGGAWFNTCSQMDVEVKFLFTVAPQPKFTREASWPMEKTKYAKVGETLRVDLGVEDPEEKSRAVSVEIFPEAYRSHIQWMNGQLIIKPTQEGKIHFKVEATTVPGQKQSESFILDVLPRTWSDIVVLSSDLEKPETLALMKLFPNVSIVHPLFQEEERTFALRKAFIVTTELLSTIKSKQSWDKLDAKMKMIPNLWVASPEVDKLQANSAYFAALLKDRDVTIPGRLSKILPSEPLKDFYLEMGKYPGLEAPKKLVKMNGSMTSQSFDPSLVEVTPGTTKCDNMLTMRARRSIGDLAAVCDHQSKGKLVIFGTEFVDFKFESEDSGVLESWIEQLLKDGGV